jgi:transcriptional regulator with XRE-family HTH domain
MRAGMGQLDRNRFGKRVRELRLAKGLTQEELAERAGLHPTYIGGIERGERNLGLDNLLKLARALNEHPAALFADFPK